VDLLLVTTLIGLSLAVILLWVYWAPNWTAPIDLLTQEVPITLATESSSLRPLILMFKWCPIKDYPPILNPSQSEPLSFI
jgi:hypothetical protein